MIYLNAFLLSGIVSAIGQIILENTKLTPGHLNAILVVIGALLSFFGVYEILVSFAGAGATVPITNFGHLLFTGAYEGFKQDGITGLLSNIFSTSSGGVTVTIVMAFLVSLFAKPKN